SKARQSHVLVQATEPQPSNCLLRHSWRPLSSSLNPPGLIIDSGAIVRMQGQGSSLPGLPQAIKRCVTHRFHRASHDSGRDPAPTTLPTIVISHRFGDTIYNQSCTGSVKPAMVI